MAVRQKEKRSKSAATAKVSAPIPISGTALAKVEPVDIVPVAPDTPLGNLSDSFIKTAQKKDKAIVAQIDRYSKDVTALGEMFSEFSKNGYHVALGFTTFVQYINDRWPNTNKTTVFEAMAIVRELTSGTNPVASKDDIREMTKENAKGLIALKKQGTEITREMIQEAKTLPVKRFQQEVVLANQPARFERPAESMEMTESASELAPATPEVMVRWPQRYVSGATEAMRVQCFDIARMLLKEDVEDHDPNGDRFVDKVYQTVFAEFIATHGADYETLKQLQAAREIQRAESNSIKMGYVSDDELSADSEAPAEAEEAAQTIEAVSAAPIVERVVEPEPDGRAFLEEGEVRVTEGYSGGPTTCEFIKPSLRRCSGMAINGTKFCYFHQEQGAEILATAGAGAIQ